MAGGVLQLIAYGAQDIYLPGICNDYNEDITYEQMIGDEICTTILEKYSNEYSNESNNEYKKIPMTGGIIQQLLAYGAQDIYLTGNPQITFFHVHRDKTIYNEDEIIHSQEEIISDENCTTVLEECSNEDDIIVINI